jgi:DNA polymerase III subunit delta'
VVDVLQRAVAAERVAHAYLFHGPDGSGKRVAALALAQALQCERRQPGEGDACGECTQCHKVERMLHPDVHVYLAEPKTASTDDVAARLQMLAEDPYSEISYRRLPDISDPEKSANLKAFYRVDRIRDINSALRYAPSEGQYKVAVLTDADTMLAPAANAFLKSLEEPSARTTFVLTASRPDTLLPTIISRCQRLRFDPLAPDDIESALLARAAAETPHAALLARMADGSLTQALQLAGSEQLGARREQVLTFLRLAFGWRLKELEPIIKDMAKMGREPLRDALGLMLTWIRDVMLMRTQGPDAPIVNVDQQPAVEAFVRNLPDARLADMAALVEHALALLAGNANTGLVLTVLAESMRDAMRGRPRDRLFTPLAG